eukprot:CAMPEP_0173125702 /NCGR_PEP_ID=MMETSP1102-20130122/56592_1 /TAXON_ID=49646 /ORGANISM="Geminigera sp., Strain Caron Lab Isolate" /LENGTH=101 /DNA_ID=CAMNT_0014034657 /DNA_START=2926 /DNA_END=3227 /DNA_ORIENTATION=+
MSSGNASCLDANVHTDIFMVHCLTSPSTGAVVTDGRVGRNVGRGQSFGHNPKGTMAAECRDGGGQGITEKAANSVRLRVTPAATAATSVRLRVTPAATAAT